MKGNVFFNTNKAAKLCIEISQLLEENTPPRLKKLHRMIVQWPLFYSCLEPNIVSLLPREPPFTKNILILKQRERESFLFGQQPLLVLKANRCQR